MNGGIIFGWFVMFALLGSLSAYIASKKNRSVAGFFLLGFFFPLIGLIVALIIGPGQPSAPTGMRAVVCPRCNARQNVDAAQGSYECWQCKLVTPVA